MAMKLFDTTAAPVDRSAGQGPPRCCRRFVVAADELVWCGALPGALLTALRAAAPRWANIPDAVFYLCGSCREAVFRHKVISREQWARGHGQSPARIAAAWVHDEQFWRRGPSSAPTEVQLQAWWAQYQSLYLTTPHEQFQGAVQQLLRNWIAQ